MNKNRFSGLFLTGKVCSLPLMINQARADVTPTYSDMIGTALHVIEIPSSSAVRLQSITGDASASPASSYVGSNYAAAFCTNAGLPTTATFVVVGVNQGETVVLAAASNRNDPANLAFNSKLTLGAQGMTILGSADVGNSLTPKTAVKGSVSFVVDTSKLQSLGTSGKFYVQAAIIPAGTTQTPASWRFSELDEISVGACVSSTYGTTPGTYGSTPSNSGSTPTTPTTTTPTTGSTSPVTSTTPVTGSCPATIPLPVPGRGSMTSCLSITIGSDPNLLNSNNSCGATFTNHCSTKILSNMCLDVGDGLGYYCKVDASSALFIHELAPGQSVTLSYRYKFLYMGCSDGVYWDPTCPHGTNVP